MSDAVSAAGKYASGPQAETPRNAEPSSNYSNSRSFSQVLRAGVKEPRGPQVPASPVDKQFLTTGGGTAPEAGQEAGSALGGTRGRAELEERSAGERHGQEEGERGLGACEWFDPLVRSLASQPLRASPPVVAAPTAVPVPVELEQLLRDLVRRAAWGGDRRRGTARIELAAGELAGATLLVEADANDLRIDLELPAGVAAEPWRQRLASRLSERGFAVSELNVY